MMSRVPGVTVTVIRLSTCLFIPSHSLLCMQVMSRVPGVTVTPHHARIEEKPLDFYEQFHVIILGLDSLEARRHMNSVACSLLGESFCSADGPGGALSSKPDTLAAAVIIHLLR